MAVVVQEYTLDPPKLPPEKAFVVVPMLGILGPGVKIVTCTCDVTVIKGTDAAAASMKDGDPVISEDGLSISQKIRNGVAGCKYKLTFHFVNDDTSEPEVRLILPVVSERYG